MTKSGMSDVVEMLGRMVAGGFTLASLLLSAYTSVDPDPGCPTPENNTKH